MGFNPKFIIIYTILNDRPAFALYAADKYNGGVLGYNGDSNVSISVNGTSFKPYRISGTYIAYWFINSSNQALNTKYSDIIPYIGIQTIACENGIHIFIIDTAANFGVNIIANCYKVLYTEEINREQVIIIGVSSSEENVIINPNYPDDYFTLKHIIIG